MVSADVDLQHMYASTVDEANFYLNIFNSDQVKCSELEGCFCRVLLMFLFLLKQGGTFLYVQRVHSSIKACSFFSIMFNLLNHVYSSKACYVTDIHIMVNLA